MRLNYYSVSSQKMRDSAVWKAVESSYFERVKTLICKQISRQSLGKGAEQEAGGSAEGCAAAADGCGAPGKNWKRNLELVEEMEPKCSTTFDHDVTSLRHLEEMEKETSGATGGVTLDVIQKDLEARQVSARKKVRCRQHRLDCILEVFELEADSIIGQLESSEGTEVDFTSSQRVMRLKGMMKEAMLTAENLGSAKREAITVELIYSSCGLLRQLLSRLSQPLVAQPLNGQPLRTDELQMRVLEPVFPSEASSIRNLTEQRREIEEEGSCGRGGSGGRCDIMLQGCSSIKDERTVTFENDLTSENPNTNSATKKEDSTLTSRSFSSSSFQSSLSSFPSPSTGVTSQSSVLSQSSFSFFHIPFLGACSYYLSFTLSLLLFLISSLQRAASSDRKVRPRSSKPSAVTPKFAQKLTNGLRDIFRGKVNVKVEDVRKNHVDECGKGDAGICVKSAMETEESAHSWNGWQLMLWKRMRSSLESVSEGKSWNLMVHHVMGWITSSATTRTSMVLPPMKMKSKGRAEEERSAGWMWSSLLLICFVAWIISIFCFDQSPMILVRMIGRMIRWILFDPLVDLRHRGVTPI